jgi:hypothetical protein
MRLRLAVTLANVSAILVALALIWGPEVAAYWVSTGRIDDAAYRRALVEPRDAVMDEILQFHSGLPITGELGSPVAQESLTQDADRLIGGHVQFHRQPDVEIAFPFRASNLDAGPPTHQLYVAGLGTVELLLRAYRASSSEAYFDAATREILAFAEVDRQSLVPRGLLWNDHALANSVRIIVDYWRVARRKSTFPPEAADEVLGLASRTAARLAKPELFTYRTNHGVMQNVALLQFSLAFPWHARSHEYGALACRRLDEQMAFYEGTEGAILEHSAGYQEFGRNVLSAAERLRRLAGCAGASEWSELLERVRAFSAMLRRPDGSLPVYGNTDYAHYVGPSLDVPVSAPPQAFGLYPNSGFAVWWTGLDAWPNQDRLTQTAVTWSNFPSRAHKLADDLSVVIWARGIPWIGNTGYWPYGMQGYESAQGWRSSNAPHFSAEAAQAERRSTLRGFGESDRLRVLDIERHSVDQSSVLRRQIVALDGDIWVIADSVSAQRSETVERLWTTQPDMQVRRLGDTSYLLSRQGESLAVRLSVLGDLDGAPELTVGSLEPFAGWTVRDGKPLPSPALVVRQKARNSRVFTVMELGRADELSARPAAALEPDDVSQGWMLSLQRDGRELTVAWTDTQVVAGLDDGSSAKVQLRQSEGAEISNRILSAYLKAEATYPRFKELTRYRRRLSILAAGLVVGQEIAVAAVRRWWASGALLLRAVATASWIAFGLLSAFWYLK